jgi:aminomuconate-semialdehyde/2-hydroxymuconate-6-semialdehyde dehydrogenase
MNGTRTWIAGTTTGRNTWAASPWWVGAMTGDREDMFRREDALAKRRDLARAYGWVRRQDPGASAVESTPQPMTLGHFINGKITPPASGKYLQKMDPARNTLLCEVPDGNAADVQQAVATAEAARRAWAETPLGERCRVLDQAADLIEYNRERLARLECEDTGKPLTLCRDLDIPRAARNFRFYAEFLRNRREAVHPMAGHRNITHRVPVGVVGLITPWNLPLYLLTWKTAPALGLGNAVIAKPSELTPRTADALAQILREAGLPDGVFNVVHGGAAAGQALVEHPAVRAISFTGGTATGSKVAKSAGAKKISLELGGKNASIVFADCDLEVTVAGVARASMTNQGQVCLCGSRILVERSLADTFVQKLGARFRDMKIGDPLDESTELGSLITPQHLAKVESYLAVARKEGANVDGGVRPKLPSELAGSFLSPAIITNVAQDSRCVQEEIFGPVVTVQPFDTAEEAIRLANDVRYGLSATVWSQDLAKAQRVAEKLETGMVWVNCWLVRELAVPFGGVKDSGVGREGGEWSVDFYSEARNICIKEEAK